jgi:hypothetical protein
LATGPSDHSQVLAGPRLAEVERIRPGARVRVTRRKLESLGMAIAPAELIQDRRKRREVVVSAL